MVSQAQPKTETIESLLAELEKRSLLIVSGKGGVGRSTVALLIAQGLAARGKRVLLATTGADDRLATLSGLHQLSEQPQSPRSGLSLVRLSPAHSVREYAEMVLWSRRIARAIFENKIVRRLLAAIPGMEDFAVLGKVWHEATRAQNYDHVIFDGPASGHLQTTLRSPQSIVDTLGQGPLAKEARSMVRSLRDSEQVGLVLVALPQAWPLTELAELEGALSQEPGVGACALVVNQLWACSLGELAPALDSEDPDGRLSACLELGRAARSRATADAKVVKDWKEGLSARMQGLPLMKIPYAPAGLVGPSALAALEEGLEVEWGSQQRCDEGSL